VRHILPQSAYARRSERPSEIEKCRDGSLICAATALPSWMS